MLNTFSVNQTKTQLPYQIQTLFAHIYIKMVPILCNTLVYCKKLLLDFGGFSVRHTELTLVVYWQCAFC